MNAPEDQAASNAHERRPWVAYTAPGYEPPLIRELDTWKVAVAVVVLVIVAWLLPS